MREVTIRFVQDKKFRVEVGWSPSQGNPTEDAATEAFAPVLDMAIRLILPKQVGYGEGKSPEEARQRAFIDRDIGAAGREEAP